MPHVDAGQRGWTFGVQRCVLFVWVSAIGRYRRLLLQRLCLTPPFAKKILQQTGAILRLHPTSQSTVVVEARFVE